MECEEVEIQPKILCLFGEINPDTAKDVVEFFTDNMDNNINLIINSEGGDVDSCIAILEVIEFHKQHHIVSTIGCGACYSSGAMILAAGTKGYRFITPLSTVFFHQIQMELPEDSFKKHEWYVKFQAKHNLLLTKRMSKLCNKTIKTYEKLLDSDSWLTAQDALKHRIVDKIIEQFEFC